MLKLKTFSKDKKGATAVEFALIATPFFMLLFGILEVALIFFANIMLDKAVSDLAREIRIGNLDSDNVDVSTFREYICNDIDVIMKCENLSIDARPIPNFTSALSSGPIDSKGNLNTKSFKFDTGDAGEIVMVRAYYKWKLAVPGLISGLANAPNNIHLIGSTTAFRNEPF